MSAWIIEPREPLIVRDGRPFDPQPGVVAATLPFPFPSTTAGAARHLAGCTDGVFTVPQADLAELLTIQVRGPLLAEETDDQTWRLLVPAPADALLLEHDRDHFRRKPLVMIKPFDGQLAGACRQSEQQPLQFLGPRLYEAAKPAKGQPAFWHWDTFAQWLLRSQEEESTLEGDLIARQKLGILPLRQQQRLHVSLEPDQMVAREGALFETRALEFTTPPEKPEQPPLAQARRLALWLDVEEHKRYTIRQQGLASLGGERRLVHWRRSTLQRESFQKLHTQISQAILQTRACRLILLTPAYLRDGYLPDLADWTFAGVTPVLHAALVQRPQVVSGWDLAQGQRKPTRRLAPAGSVFFLSFPACEDSALAAWIEHFWLNTCVSNDPQASRDGFGLAALGTWSKQSYTMQFKEHSA